MKLFFQVYGEGRPLIILHGLFGLSDNWVTIGKNLAEHFRVYIPDLRNHGQSPHSPVFDFPALEDDLLEFVETHELDRAILMGHSLGGKTAMFFALHQPQRVEKLIVVDISLRRYGYRAEHQELIDAMLGTDLSVAKTRGDVERQLRERIENPRLRQFVLKNLYWRDRGRMAWRPNLKAINDNLSAVIEGVSVSGEYDGPALFIRGGRSAYISDDDLELIKTKFPGSVVKTIAQATHWVHADAPGEFIGIVRNFLLAGQ